MVGLEASVLLPFNNKNDNFLKKLKIPINTITTNTEKYLKNLGVNVYEFRIWTALLRKNTPTAGKLSGVANVPRSRSYDIFKSPEEKGFVVSAAGKGYGGRSPAAVKG